MNKKISIIGNFGNPGNENNGQTVKTKTIHKALTEKYGSETIIIADTNRISNSPLKILQELIHAIFAGDLIILAVCDYAIKFLAFPLFLLAKLLGKKIVYVLIGGWLGKFVNNHFFSKLALKKYDYIFAETRVCGEELKKIGFQNISYIDNCKYLSVQNNETIFDENDLHFCTLSRIVPEKGIEEAVHAVTMANKNGKSTFYLDVFGEIAPEYKQDFQTLIETNADYVTYRGIVKFEDCPRVISNYDALLFPTRVMTEGMPGTVIDAMFAGTPVIATKWNACEEIITNGYNGFSYSGNELELLSLISTDNIKHVLASMRANCLNSAERFTPEVALSPLFRFFEEHVL